MNGNEGLTASDVALLAGNNKNLQFRRRGEGNYANYNLSDYDDEEEDFEYYTREYPRYYRRYYK